MEDAKKIKIGLLKGDFDKELERVYVSESEVVHNRERISRLIDVFLSLYGEGKEVEVFSAPGRTEVGGNHTDHNHGRVLAASINLDAIAVVSLNNDSTIRIKSERYPNVDTIKLDSLEVNEKEKGKSTGLIRGVCAAFVERGYKIGGFDAATFSDVLTGSGLSSSAAFEVLVGTILNHLFNEGKIDPIEIAQISQYSENEFFGKPCGLMDQMACSVGGFVAIDFEDPEKPLIEKVDFDFEKSGHALCIVDTKGNHAGLDDEYGAVRLEMEAVAKHFGKKNLRELPQNIFEKDIAGLRKKVGDRALLRAFHFYNENERVLKLVAALENKNFDDFKDNIIESGFSSYMYNQNIYLAGQPKTQPVALALCLSEEVLKGRGAWRVHGGGFAGTIQAFVPHDLLDEYKKRLNSAFGEEACKVLSVRPVGGSKIL